MDGATRRSRRGRCHSHTMPHSFSPPSPAQCSKPFSILSCLYSLTVMASLIALVYMMLEYHCNTCSSKCDLSTLTKNIDDIAQNIAAMKDNYYELETKISKFSQELPKIEGQIDILEALANTIEHGHFGWDPKSHLCLPNVDVFLNHCSGDTSNITRKCPRKCQRSYRVKHHSIHSEPRAQLE